MRSELVDAVVTLAQSLGGRCGAPEILSERANSVIRLGPNLVARVATLTTVLRGAAAREAMARSIVVARHLEAALVPALRVSGAIDPGPHPSAAHFVTFWEHVDHDASRPVDPIRAGDRLRELHETLASLPREGFPRLGPFTELPPMIDALVGSRAFSEREGALLSSRLEASLADIETLGLPETVLHGDASPGNLLHTPDGPIWSDFEEACVGPRELDLACIVATARAFDLPSRPLREAILVASGPHDEVVLRPFSDARVIQSLVWEAAMSTGDEAARAAASARRAAWERSLK